MFHWQEPVPHVYGNCYVSASLKADTEIALHPLFVPYVLLDITKNAWKETWWCLKKAKARYSNDDQRRLSYPNSTSCHVMSHPRDTPQCRTSHFLSVLTPAGKVQDYACGPIDFKAKNKMWDVPSPPQVWFSTLLQILQEFRGLKKVPAWSCGFCFWSPSVSKGHLGLRNFTVDIWHQEKKKTSNHPMSWNVTSFNCQEAIIKHHSSSNLSQSSITISQVVLAKYTSYKHQTSIKIGVTLHSTKGLLPSAAVPTARVQWKTERPPVVGWQDGPWVVGQQL